MSTPHRHCTLLPEPSPPSHPPHLSHLARIILHNLQHQHDWTDLAIHTHSSSSSSSSPSSLDGSTLLPRPLLSGLPPHRIYIHPDEQVAMLERERGGEKADSSEAQGSEWVLPSHVREKWSLSRLARCFDALPTGRREEEEEWEDATRERKAGAKRLLLATVCDDSTVVYYVVHDGIVKPRQN